jgi:hypothetical protein
MLRVATANTRKCFQDITQRNQRPLAFSIVFAIQRLVLATNPQAVLGIDLDWFVNYAIRVIIDRGKIVENAQGKSCCWCFYYFFS